MTGVAPTNERHARESGHPEKPTMSIGCKNVINDETSTSTGFFACDLEDTGSEMDQKDSR